MDARQRRTRDRLDESILALARELPIDQISVADVARRADLSRDTFYRWSASPIDLLADTLGRRLDDIIDGYSGTISATSLDPLTETLLAFIANHAAIYRHASSPRLHATLRDGLVSHIEQRLTCWIENHPEILPLMDGEAPDAFARDVFVAYAASGVVGAYEVWLARGDLTDIPAIEARIYAAAASWWH